MINESNNNIYFHIYQISNPNFNIKVSKRTFDIISKLYGEESIQFNTFIKYLTQKNISTITQEKTMKKELDDTEANILSEGLNNLGKYYIIPESLKSLDEDKQYEQAIKLPGKFITHIMKKAGINLESMIYYLGLQIVSHEINENVVINYYLLERIFKLIPTVSIKFNNKNDTDITFFSFNQILKNSGIKLDEIIPFLHIDIKNIDRQTLNNNNIPVYRAYQIRQIKNLIAPEIQDTNIDIMKGADSLIRMEKNDFDNFDVLRNEESNLLKDILNKIKTKKEEIKNIYENEENHIIEINDINNEVAFVKKNVYENLLKNIENINDVKILDINGNEISIAKDYIIENQKKINGPLIKLYQDNNKNEYIFISIGELKNKFNNEFNYIKQEAIFSGKGIKGEPKKFQGLFMQIQCEKLSESNQNMIQKNKILISPKKENNNEINNFINSKEKLNSNETDKKGEYDMEHEYQNMINPYDGIPFKQVRTIKSEEDKNDDNNTSEKKLRITPKREIKIFRIRRAVLFKRPTETKKEPENNKLES